MDLIHCDWCFYKRRRLGHRYSRRKTTWRYREKTTICKPMRQVSEDPCRCLDLELVLQNWEMIHVCCPDPPVWLSCQGSPDNDHRCWRTRARARHVGPCFWWEAFWVPGPQESEYTVSAQSVLVDLYTQNGMKTSEIKRLTFGKYRVAYWSWACRVLWAGVGGILACEYVVAWSWLREYSMFPSFLF